jgi:hypothetical protein
LRPAQQLLLAAGVCIAGYSSLMRDSQAQTVSAKDIARCATITADAERLSCYDQLARNSHTEGQAAAPAPPEHSDQSFGMRQLPTAKPPGPSRLEAKVLEVATDSRGAVVVKLDNDQTWTLEDGLAILRAGDAIVIKRAALGSFLMMTPTGRIYRARRLQ